MKKLTAPARGATSHISQLLQRLIKPSVRNATMNNSQSNSAPTKHERCIYELLKAGTTGINQLKALSTYRDTCLNTTISELGRHRGLLITREKRPHRNTAGGNSPFCSYWFGDSHEAEKAIKLLNKLRKKREALPLEEREAQLLLAQFPDPEMSAA